MAAIVVRLYSNNPNDGTTSFDQVKFYEATSSAGAGKALITTVSIDTTNRNPIDPGFTSKLHTTGDNTKYAASAWYNSTTTVETRTSDWVLQGEDRWDTMFKNEMQDTAEAVWTATDRKSYKSRALEALYPDFFFESIDTSLTIANNSTTQTHQFSLPFGMFLVAEVGVGKPNDQTNQPFKILHPDNWTIEQDKLNIKSLSGLTDTHQIRMIGSKKYMEVGEIPLRLDPLALIHMRMSAYLRLSDDYPRFLKWSRMQKGTKVTFAELKAWIKDLDRLFEAEKGRLRDMFMPIRT